MDLYRLLTMDLKINVTNAPVTVYVYYVFAFPAASKLVLRTAAIQISFAHSLHKKFFTY